MLPLKHLRHTDLIETLWNVKLTETPALNHHPEDLIETLWNVKESFRQ